MRMGVKVVKRVFAVTFSFKEQGLPRSGSVSGRRNSCQGLSHCRVIAGGRTPWVLDSTSRNGHACRLAALSAPHQALRGLCSPRALGRE